LPKLKQIKTDTKTQWTTSAGIFETKYKALAPMIFTELHEGKTITCEAHVAPDLGAYDMIVGREILKELGITLNFKEETVEWDEVVIPMKPENAIPEKHFAIADSASLDDATERIKSILDAKYEPADLNKIVKECIHLSKKEQSELFYLLKKYSCLFDGSLGTWKDEEYNIELKPDAKPYHARAFPIPRIHEATLKLEVRRLCELGVLRKINRSEWAAPTFIIPKKDGTVRFISDFRQLNLRIKRKPFPIPKIQDLLLKLEGFQYATSLDLNMGYYHIRLSPFSKSLCTIVLPWGKYEYQRLPMGLCNSPDIFQEKMSNLMADLEFCRAYIDDLLILSKGTWSEHLENLETVFKRLKDSGLKVNANKSFFGKPELEYLGYWITRNGIQPVTKKIDAILNIDVPKTKRELRRFIGMVNYYRDMWIRRSDILCPLTKLVSNSAKWIWTDEQQKAFEAMKLIISKETLLSYPDFTQPFDLHTDASNTQLGAVLSQHNKPIAFYSRKLNPAQTRYTTTERELLAIVETLKEFRNILLGQQIRVYTDHQNLTYKNFNTERVLRWRLILEEFGPDLLYVPGKKNIVADALSRLPFKEYLQPADPEMHQLTLAELFGGSKVDLPSHIYPLKFSTIYKAQKADKYLQRHSGSDKFHFNTFRGGDNTHTLICHKGKIVVPKSLQKHLVEWYHRTLCHPGMTRSEQTIRQHFWWKTLREDVQKECSTCDICQRTKVKNSKYGKLPEKEAEINPWEKLCVDMIGPYTIKRRGSTPLTLWCVTMIDPSTGWFEMKQVKDKEAFTVATVVEQTWLNRYPWPVQLIFDKGTEFMAEFAEMVQNDYGIKRKGTTVRNPQANAILERIHQTLGNIIRTFDIYNNEGLDPEDPWSGILGAAMFAIRATFHTTLQATPAQLVFGRDAILNSKFEADWNFIKANKQRLIHINNQKENKSRISHQYNINDEILCESKPTKSKFGPALWEGPFRIVKVNDNGTVRIRKGVVTETVHIRRIKPYHNAT
jgi:RNase H-like domain found in reverse transcriptase/Reverse transcriptase (RNA-dependent DNA polymerase)/Integrase zinc binding domain